MQPPPIIGVRHVALNVRKLERSLEFYRTVFGFELEWFPDPENAYLTSGSDNIALHALPEGQEPSGAQFLDHIGFVVRKPEDVDAWADRVESLGYNLKQPPRTHRDGARSFYMADPDGIVIQVIYHPPISGK